VRFVQSLHEPSLVTRNQARIVRVACKCGMKRIAPIRYTRVIELECSGSPPQPFRDSRAVYVSVEENDGTLRVECHSALDRAEAKTRLWR